MDKTWYKKAIRKHESKLSALLIAASKVGFIGKISLASLVDHTAGFVLIPSWMGKHNITRVLDIGSGAGIPALAMALLWPNAEFTLIERSQKRAAFLTNQIYELGVAGQCKVLCDDAFKLVNNEQFSCMFDYVTARLFAKPELYIKTASYFCKLGGIATCSISKEVWDLRSSSEMPKPEFMSIPQFFSYQNYYFMALERTKAC